MGWCQRRSVKSPRCGIRFPSPPAFGCFSEVSYLTVGAFRRDLIRGSLYLIRDLIPYRVTPSQNGSFVDDLVPSAEASQDPRRALRAVRLVAGIAGEEVDRFDLPYAEIE